MATTRFIYALIDPRTSAVRYVGQAVDVARRAVRHVHDSVRSAKVRGYTSRKEQWVLELLACGLRPLYETIETLTSKRDANDAERRWIAHYLADQAGELTNTSLGGDGPPGATPSEITKQRISAAKTGRKATAAELAHILLLAERRRGTRINMESYERTRAANKGRAKTPEEIEKLRAANKGKTVSPATRALMVEAQRRISPAEHKARGLLRRGKKRSPEAIEKSAKGNRGKKRTPEHIEIIRATHTGKVFSAESRRKLSIAHTGKRLSPEHREKSIQCLRVINERRRAERAARRNDPRQELLFQ